LDDIPDGLPGASRGPGGQAHREGREQEDDGEPNEHAFACYRTPVRPSSRVPGLTPDVSQSVTSSGVIREPRIRSTSMLWTGWRRRSVGEPGFRTQRCWKCSTCGTCVCP